MESIKSVQDNPFFKKLGIKPNASSVSRRSHRSQTPDQNNRHSLNGPIFNNDDDEIGEYHPVSGFVHKLLDRFSLLNTRDEQSAPLSSLKRFSSLDQLVHDENEATSNKISQETGPDSTMTLDRPSKLSSSKFAHKARSIENLSDVQHKPPQYSRPGVSTQNTDKKSYKNRESTSSKFVRDHDIARDNIIIIENTPSVSVKGSKIDESHGNDPSFNVANNHDTVFEDEMPKPNTVFTVRSIFENASSQSNLYLRRRKSDQPLSPASPTSPSSRGGLFSLQTELSSLNQYGDSKQNSLQSPSPLTSPRHGGENHAKPVLLPTGAALKRQFDSTRHPPELYKNSKSDDVQSLSPLSPGTNQLASIISSNENSHTLSSSSLNSQRDVDNNSPRLEIVDTSTTTKSSSNQHSTSFTRSTASVKPTLNNKQNAPVTPVPLSVPASSSTSYQKSRPVVSVAPYKDKPEDGKNDELPANTDPKLSPRGEKLHRTNESAQQSDFPKEIKNEEIKQEDIILPKDAKKIFEKNITNKTLAESNNKMLSLGRRSIDVNNKNAENNITNLNKMDQTKQFTAIELRSVSNRSHQVGNETFKSTEKESDLRPVKLVATSGKKITSPKRIAPQPPGNLQPHKNDTSVSQHHSKKDSRSIAEVENSQPVTPSDIMPTSNQSQPKDSTAMDEPPFKKVLENQSESQEQPIKGIPSIIAQRLKKQSSNPSQIASDMVSVPDAATNFSSNDSVNPYPRKLLSPAGATSVSSSSDNVEKDTVISEIENEITAVRRKMEANRLKTSAPAQIFDSSQLAKKKKSNQQQRTASDGLVPPLELSKITDDDIEYRPHLTKVKPCNIVFIGENAKTSRSLLDKKRTIKINIHFDDLKTETFEYPSEEVALESYLEDHPNEREEVVVLEDAVDRNGESSDDVEIDVYMTGSGEGGKDGLLVSNTGLSHSGGNFQSYRGRFQQEYEFGTVLTEQPTAPVDPEPTVDPEKLMLRPAEEDDTNNWSTSNSSDILF